MYLLVFITLVISLTGLYTQVFALQAARIMGSQTGLANSMLTWHSTALALAQYSVDAGTGGLSPNYDGSTGCSLSSISPPGGIPKCFIAASYGGSPAVVTAAGTPPGSIPDCTTTTPSYTAPCWRSLPVGYQTSPYAFFSIAFQLQPASQNYVITFVPPPTVTTSCPINGFICLPGPTAPLASQYQLGFTMSDLTSQLGRTLTPVLAYGTVIKGAVVTAGVSNSITATVLTRESINYPVPGGENVEVPDGSIAIISTPIAPPCTGC